jgi:hypothetical protein
VLRLFLVLLLALLAGCGSKNEGNPGDGGNGSSGQVQPIEGDLSNLDGLPVEDFVRAIVPRLTMDAQTQTASQLAAGLDQNWKIHCEQICRIERK